MNDNYQKLYGEKEKPRKTIEDLMERDKNGFKPETHKDGVTMNKRMHDDEMIFHVRGDY